MQQTTVKCDSCQKVAVTDSQYPAVYMIELRTINVHRSTTGMTYAVHMEPEISKAMHFCNLVCLKDWINKTRKGAV